MDIVETIFVVTFFCIIIAVIIFNEKYIDLVYRFCEFFGTKLNPNHRNFYKYGTIIVGIFMMSVIIIELIRG